MGSRLQAQTPIIDDISSSSEPFGSATIIVIQGQNFGSNIANNAVFVGGVRATITDVQPTSLSITLPRGMNTVAPITVVNLENGLQTSSLRADNPSLVQLFTTTNTPVTINSSSYTPNLITPPSFTPSAVAAGDFNGDGWMDIAAADASANLDNVVI
ncbi:MAG: IPT/TIG domain-containing protein, partial [Bacteroidota bacterium]